MTDITEQLKTIFQSRLKENELMAKHLNIKIGGPARWFVEVKTVEEFGHVLKIVHENDVPHFILGGGSNTLFSDDGFEGVVIKVAMREITIDGTKVTADAGAISAVVARQTATAGLQGFEWAISLPGTIGGAVRGNAGCFGGEVRDTLVSAEVYRNGEIVELSKDDLDFGYRESSIKHSDDIVLRVTFELERGDAVELTKKLDETLAKRKSSQPLHAGSAGCMFKNYEIGSDEELEKLKQDADIPAEMIENKKLSAGWIIDQLDLKGTKVGGAMISEEHGNFLINTGEATASDVVQLISMIKMKARDRYGVQLQEEVEYVGF